MLERKKETVEIGWNCILIANEIDWTRWKLWEAVNGRECRYIGQANKIKKCLKEIYFGEMIKEVLSYEFLCKLADLIDLYHRIVNGGDRKLVKTYIELREEIKALLHKDNNCWYENLSWICSNLSQEQLSKLTSDLDNRFLDKLLAELEYME